MLAIDPTVQPDTSTPGQGQYGSWVINGHTYLYKAKNANQVPEFGVNLFKN